MLNQYDLVDIRDDVYHSWICIGSILLMRLCSFFTINGRVWFYHTGMNTCWKVAYCFVQNTEWDDAHICNF